MALKDFDWGPKFAFMQFPGFMVFSYYWRLGSPLREFEGFLSDLEAEMKMRLRPDQAVVLAGDFNAKARSWGSGFDNQRRVVLQEFATSLGLWPEKMEPVPIFAVGRPHLGD